MAPDGSGTVTQHPLSVNALRTDILKLEASNARAALKR